MDTYIEALESAGADRAKFYAVLVAVARLPAPQVHEIAHKYCRSGRRHWYTRKNALRAIEDTWLKREF